MKHKPKYDSFHKLAKRYLSNGYCEICGISELMSMKVNSRKLDMHCVSGDYTIIKQDNWQTLCLGCHRKLRSIEPNLSEYEKNKILNNIDDRYEMFKSEHKRKYKDCVKIKLYTKMGNKINLNLNLDIFNELLKIASFREWTINHVIRRILQEGTGLKPVKFFKKETK